MHYNTNMIITIYTNMKDHQTFNHLDFLIHLMQHQHKGRRLYSGVFLVYFHIVHQVSTHYQTLLLLLLSHAVVMVLDIPLFCLLFGGGEKSMK